MCYYYCRQWGWMVAGAAPGLQIRVSGRRTFRGVFDSHAFPPLIEVRDSEKLFFCFTIH